MENECIKCKKMIEIKPVDGFEGIELETEMCLISGSSLSTKITNEFNCLDYSFSFEVCKDCLSEIKKFIENKN